MDAGDSLTPEPSLSPHGIGTTSNSPMQHRICLEDVTTVNAIVQTWTILFNTLVRKLGIATFPQCTGGIRDGVGYNWQF